MTTKKLIWEDRYSVGVEEIDGQHKALFSIINNLLDAISSDKTTEHLKVVVESLIKYKKFHFETEEKYFREFNYEEKDEHTRIHNDFGEKLNKMKEKYSEYTIEFAFELVDFLEDWLIKHLMTADQKYISCFKEHGLK